MQIADPYSLKYIFIQFESDKSRFAIGRLLDVGRSSRKKNANITEISESIQFI